VMRIHGGGNKRAHAASQRGSWSNTFCKMTLRC
jgi:hypothetical protein